MTRQIEKVLPKLEGAPFSDKETNCSYFRYCTLTCSITLFIFSFFKTLHLGEATNLMKIRSKFLMILMVMSEEIFVIFLMFWM